MICKHCSKYTRPADYPFCSWCKLFLLEPEELDLSPNQQDINKWKRDDG